MQSVLYIVDQKMSRLILMGYLRTYELRVESYGNAIRLECTPSNGRLLLYRLTEMEINNGGLDGIRFWLETVHHDIRRRVENERRLIAQLQPDYSSAFRQQAAQQSALSQQYLGDQPAWPSLTQAQMIQNIANQQRWRQSYAPNEKAQARSAELFILACGKEAFDTLNAGKPLPITGSKGTKYTLHKRASYCVERVSNNDRLCAVVPGVPLWDHLLGIKLMIEHDEPKFLETANVAQNFLWNDLAANVMANNELLNRLRYMEQTRVSHAMQQQSMAQDALWQQGMA